MFIKRILKIGLVAIVASALTTVQAQVPDKKPDKEKPSKHDKGRTYKKWDSDKVKARLKAAFDQRKKKRGDAKKRGHKVRDRKKGDHKKDSGFGKLVRDDAKIKELKEAFAAAAKKGHKGFDRAAWKDATDDEKKALREKMSAGRKEWYEKMKTHREEVGKRIKEIREEFKNNRDKVIDGNDPGEWKGENIVIQYHKPYYIPSSIADRKTKSAPEVNWELRIPRSKVGRVVIRRPASRGGDIVIE